MGAERSRISTLCATTRLCVALEFERPFTLEPHPNPEYIALNAGSRGATIRRHVVVVTLILTGALLLSACGATNTTAPTTTTAAATTTTSAATQDLVVTSAVRRGLLAAGAGFHHLPTSDFAGLDAATTYYAFDPSTGTYYTAAGLMARRSSLAAQVGTQDDGAYNLFTKRSGAATWTVYDDGLGGVQGAHCPIALPGSVLAVWHWSAHRCYPPAPG